MLKVSTDLIPDSVAAYDILSKKTDKMSGVAVLIQGMEMIGLRWMVKICLHGIRR
jgi:hypothetical protein